MPSISTSTVLPGFIEPDADRRAAQDDVAGMQRHVLARSALTSCATEKRMSLIG